MSFAPREAGPTRPLVPPLGVHTESDAENALDEASWLGYEAAFPGAWMALLGPSEEPALLA